MAGEIKTLTTTVPGLMEEKQAHLTSQFRIKSRLFEGCWGVPADNKETVQFPSVPAPSPVDQHTEADALASSTVTIGAAPAALEPFAKETPTSKLALKGGAYISDYTLSVLLNDCVAGLDKHIAAHFDSFTAGNDQTGVASYAKFCDATAACEDLGYNGKLMCALSPGQYNLVAQDLPGSTTQMQNYVSYGYQREINGVSVFVVPSGWLATDTNKVGAMWYQEFGIGLGYAAEGSEDDSPILIDITVQEMTAHAVLGVCLYAQAALLNAGGGVAIKWALS